MKFSTREVAAAAYDAVSHTTVAAYYAGRSVSPPSREVIENAIRRLESEHLAAEEAARIAEDLSLGRAIRRAIGGA